MERGVDQRVSTDGPVRSSTQAISIARNTAVSSGVLFSVATYAEKKGSTWVVKLESFGNMYEAQIAATSGAVTSWKRV